MGPLPRQAPEADGVVGALLPPPEDMPPWLGAYRRRRGRRPTANFRRRRRSSGPRMSPETGGGGRERERPSEPARVGGSLESPSASAGTTLTTDFSRRRFPARRGGRPGFPADRASRRRQFYLGGPLSGSPPHFHGAAINGLAYGAKLWRLTPPADATYSSVPASSHFAEIAPEVAPRVRRRWQFRGTRGRGRPPAVEDSRSERRDSRAGGALRPAVGRRPLRAEQLGPRGPQPRDERRRRRRARLPRRRLGRGGG